MYEQKENTACAYQILALMGARVWIKMAADSRASVHLASVESTANQVRRCFN